MAEHHDVLGPHPQGDRQVPELIPARGAEKDEVVWAAFNAGFNCEASSASQAA